MSVCGCAGGASEQRSSATHRFGGLQLPEEACFDTYLSFGGSAAPLALVLTCVFHSCGTMLCSALPSARRHSLLLGGCAESTVSLLDLACFVVWAGGRVGCLELLGGFRKEGPERRESCSLLVGMGCCRKLV